MNFEFFAFNEILVEFWRDWQTLCKERKEKRKIWNDSFLRRGEVFEDLKKEFWKR